MKSVMFIRWFGPFWHEISWFWTFWTFWPKTVCVAHTEAVSVVERQDLCCGKTRSLLWQDKMCVVARQDLCCGKTRSLLWQDIREAACGRLHKGGRAPAAPAPLCGFPYVLPQQRSCLATTEILSCHNKDLVSTKARYYDAIRRYYDTIRHYYDAIRHY